MFKIRTGMEIALFSMLELLMYCSFKQYIKKF